MSEILKLVPSEKISVVCRKVELFDEPFQEFVDNMIATLLETNNGVGLAANQVGSELAVAVIRPYLHDLKRRDETYVIVNPTYSVRPWTHQLVEEEGCLSFPGRFEQIPRAKTIELRAADRTGAITTTKVHGWLARILQHEIDHLNGLVCFSKAAKFDDRLLDKSIRNKRRKHVKAKA